MEGAGSMTIAGQPWAREWGTTPKVVCVRDSVSRQSLRAPHLRDWVREGEREKWAERGGGSGKDD